MKKLCAYCVAVVLLSAASAVARDHSNPATLTVVNETYMPLAVDVSESSETVSVRPARPGASGMLLPPGGDAAMRVSHGRWRVAGEGGNSFETRFHQGTTPIVRFRSFAHGHRQGILGVVDDGYSTQSEELLSFDRPPEMAPPPGYPYYVDPRHSPYGEPQPAPDSSGELLGEVVADAVTGLLDGLIHDDDDRPRPGYDRPPHGGDRPHHGGNRPPPPPPRHDGGDRHGHRWR